MAKLIKSITISLIIAICGITLNAQDTKENRYLIENAVLAFYYSHLRSEQGSLASYEQQEEFEKRKLAEEDLEYVDNHLDLNLQYNIVLLNRKLGKSKENMDIMWGDMSDAKYFTLHFDEIKFPYPNYPNMATVTATIDYGIRKVVKSYAMHRWNDIWWVYDITLSSDPSQWLGRWLLEN